MQKQRNHYNYFVRDSIIRSSIEMNISQQFTLHSEVQFASNTIQLDILYMKNEVQMKFPDRKNVLMPT